MKIKTEIEMVEATCLKCGGRGIVPKGCIANKRNSMPCPECDGKGVVMQPEEVKIKK